MRSLRSVVLAATLLCAAPAAHAATIFSTFGLGDVYDASIGWTLSLDSPLQSTDVTQGDRFVSPGQYALDRVELAAGLVTGPNELDLRLLDDNAGAPGNLIEAWHFSGALGSFGDANPPVGADSALHPVLFSGNPYWLIASASHSGTHAAWNFNSVGASGPHAIQFDNGSFGVDALPSGAFRLFGSAPSGGGQGPVLPEPSSWLLFGLGAFALGAAPFLRRIARK